MSSMASTAEAWLPFPDGEIADICHTGASPAAAVAAGYGPKMLIIRVDLP
jgi:hypothetical protein